MITAGTTWVDSAVYQLEKTLKETGDKLPAEAKSKIESALASAKQDLESNDTDRMKAAIENLGKVGQELYAQAAQAGQAGAAAGAEAGAEPDTAAKKTEKKAEVVDADFEVVDDGKDKK